MTKLMQWLVFGVVFLGIWISLISDASPVQLSVSIKEVICTVPIYLLMSFACYSLGLIGYRVATFNDCTEAAEELKMQIKEAKADLQSKGFKFS